MPENTDDPVVRPFADALRELSGGRSHEELSQSMHDLIGAVRDTGKAGSMTFTIKVAPMKKNADALLVSDSITLRAPQHDRKDSIFYTDKQGNLTRSDPNQLAFEGLREVPAAERPTAEQVRQVGS